MKLILASSSPRRKELLRQVGLDFTIRLPEVDENVVKTNDPMDKVEKLARLKSKYVPLEETDEIILSADTVVSYQNQIFEKPINEVEAFDMIQTLSGTTHEVYTGFTLRSTELEKTYVEKTVVEFWPIEERDIQRYVKTKEPYDKAGGYGIQSVGALFVKRIHGNYNNVVGLPISRVVRELASFRI